MNNNSNNKNNNRNNYAADDNSSNINNDDDGDDDHNKSTIKIMKMKMLIKKKSYKINTVSFAKQLNLKKIIAKKEQVRYM